jgi:hypothetical protein
MIEVIDNVESLYPEIIRIDAATKYWREQAGDAYEEVCLLRLFDMTTEDEKQFWSNAYQCKALRGIGYFCDRYMATEYVLAFPTKADAMVWKLTHGTE